MTFSQLKIGQWFMVGDGLYEKTAPTLAYELITETTVLVGPNQVVSLYA